MESVRSGLKGDMIGKGTSYSWKTVLNILPALWRSYLEGELEDRVAL